MKRQILAIDDDPTNLRMVKAVLEADGHEVHAFQSAPEGIEAIGKIRPQLVLLDINMPDLDGLQSLQKIRESHDYISVIFLSARSKVEEVATGLDAGADDYLRKPYDPRELISRVRAQLRIKDIRDQLAIANARLKELVNIDELTGLLNMRTVYGRLAQEIHRAERYDRDVAVVMMDMDYFKQVNDGFDHLFGSFVLKEVGKIIAQNIRKVDFAARYGGDEFFIALTETDLEGAKVFCQRLSRSIAEHKFKSGNDETHLTSSIGFAIFNGDKGSDSKSLVKQADKALYLSKEAGRNCIHYFDKDWQTSQRLEE